jgi:hypothetical protein
MYNKWSEDRINKLLQLTLNHHKTQNNNKLIVQNLDLHGMRNMNMIVGVLNLFTIENRKM